MVIHFALFSSRTAAIQENITPRNGKSCLARFLSMEEKSIHNPLDQRIRSHGIFRVSREREGMKS